MAVGANYAGGSRPVGSEHRYGVMVCERGATELLEVMRSRRGYGDDFGGGRDWR